MARSTSMIRPQDRRGVSAATGGPARLVEVTTVVVLIDVVGVKRALMTLSSAQAWWTAADLAVGEACTEG